CSSWSHILCFPRTKRVLNTLFYFFSFFAFLDKLTREFGTFSNRHNFNLIN
ncbi:Uncharacterized protein APZ42_006158, partial [Daphnia magna]